MMWGGWRTVDRCDGLLRMKHPIVGNVEEAPNVGERGLFLRVYEKGLSLTSFV
jgi:hypothetical protein